MALTISQYLERQFGVETYPRRNPLISSVGTTALELLRSNPNRLAWLFVNLSANAMYLLDKPDVSSSNGIRIPPNGGGATFLPEKDLDWLSYQWFVVADGASSNLLVIEHISR